MIRRLLVALALLVTTAAFADSGKHQAWVRAALDRAPVAKADKAPERTELRAQNLDAFAHEIARVSKKAPRSPREYAALLLTIGQHESNWSTDIVAGRCAAWECDKGRAKGAFQGHRLRFSSELWDVANANIPAQVEMADRALRRSMTRCAPFAPYPQHVFRAYRGGSCSWELKDENARAATYARVLATVVAKEAS